MSLLRCLPRRFIPAPAGNTGREAGAPPHMPVHPRACGEHSCGLLLHGPQVGSSPRLRGTLQIFLYQKDQGRFIPAPAGNTRERFALRGQSPVHPRACGEHNGESIWAWFEGGSSPRLRGTQPNVASLPAYLRFIPALRGTLKVLFVRLVVSRFIPAPAGNTSSPHP